MRDGARIRIRSSALLGHVISSEPSDSIAQEQLIPISDDASIHSAVYIARINVDVAAIISLHSKQFGFCANESELNSAQTSTPMLRSASFVHATW